MLAIGDGALGFWKALRDVWPETQEQMDWCHKMANVLDKLPKRLQPKAKRALREILCAATSSDAQVSFDGFVDEFSPTYEKAVECLARDRERLLSFFEFPAEPSTSEVGRLVVAPLESERATAQRRNANADPYNRPQLVCLAATSTARCR